MYRCNSDLLRCIINLNVLWGAKIYIVSLSFRYCYKTQTWFKDYANKYMAASVQQKLMSISNSMGRKLISLCKGFYT